MSFLNNERWTNVGLMLDLPFNAGDKNRLKLVMTLERQKKVLNIILAKLDNVSHSPPPSCQPEQGLKLCVLGHLSLHVLNLKCSEWYMSD